MSKTSSQDKTEKATPKRLKKSKEDGQVARSKDMLSAALVIGCSLYLKANIMNISIQLLHISQYNSHLTRQDLEMPGMLIEHASLSLIALLQVLAPLFICLIILVLIMGSLPGGLLFNINNCGFKFKRINPASGLKRMFSSNALVELFKSILKISLLLCISLIYLNNNFSVLMKISQLPVNEAIVAAIVFTCNGFLYLGFGMLLIAAIDLPYQLWKHLKDLKMSKQEIKDEYKQSEGKPEVKAKVRQIQQRMARSRAEVTVPNADVLIVNPEHYAVALRYDPLRAEAPFVIAKGLDEVAMYMKQIASNHGVEIISAPPLARSIYHFTQVDQQIPAGLYLAVAQVLQYVMQIKVAKNQGQTKPNSQFNFKIPPHLRT